MFELSKLEEDATQEDLEAPILKDGKTRGDLRFDVSYFPVLKPVTNESGVEALPDSSKSSAIEGVLAADHSNISDVGIVRLVLHQAKDLDTTKSHSADMNPFAKVFLGSSNLPVHSTQKVKHTVQPVWESATEFLCTDRTSSVITVKIIDDRDFLKDPVVGYTSIRLEDLLATRTEAGRDWWRLSGCKSGRLRLSAEWKPLNMAGGLHGADQYTPPIGVVRLWLQKATDVKNVEAALGGKVSYCLVDAEVSKFHLPSSRATHMYASSSTTRFRLGPRSSITVSQACDRVQSSPSEPSHRSQPRMGSNHLYSW